MVYISYSDIKTFEEEKENSWNKECIFPTHIETFVLEDHTDPNSDVTKYIKVFFDKTLNFNARRMHGLSR